MKDENVDYFTIHIIFAQKEKGEFVQMVDTLAKM